MPNDRCGSNRRSMLIYLNVHHERKGMTHIISFIAVIQHICRIFSAEKPMEAIPVSAAPRTFTAWIISN
jgi:hypothetical protein